MKTTILELVTLVTETCCSCGTIFAISENLKSSRKKDKGLFYCPNGHSQHYTQSDADRLRIQLETAQRELREEKCKTLADQQSRAYVEIEKSKLERKLKRVHRGVCPCCNRTFENLQRHMATKHKKDDITKNDVICKK